jgi:hypothetical protein
MLDARELVNLNDTLDILKRNASKNRPVFYGLLSYSKTRF